MAQASCSIQTPKASRPNEGMLFINVELSPMAAEHFEAGRLGKLGIQVNRLVERCIKGSGRICVHLKIELWTKPAVVAHFISFEWITSNL